MFETDYIDRAVDRFARRMKQKLYQNAWKGHWSQNSVELLQCRMFDELAEFQWALHQGQAEQILDEAVDVAALVMMVADVETDNTLSTLGLEVIDE